MEWQHPTGKTPETVAIVALGPSKRDFVADSGRHDPGHAADEVWAVNTAMRWCRHDVAFIMDDMNEFARHFDDYGRAMREHDKPIITSTVYDEFPTAVAYPLAEIVARCQQTYFNNSVPYLIAYAYLIGVKRLIIFGADYTFPGTEAREDGRGCTEFWLGFVAANGMTVEVCRSSTLTDANKGQRFYGYLSQPIVRMGGSGDKCPVIPDNICDYSPPGSSSAA